MLQSLSTRSLQPLVRPPPLPVPKLKLRGALALHALRGAFQIGGRVAPEASAARASQLYFSPRRFAARPSERAVLARGQRFSVPFEPSPGLSWPGGDLSAWSWGEGPAVLLVHGWQSRASMVAEPFVGPLSAAGLRTVALDLPGHGASPGRRADLLAFVAAMKAVARQVGPVHAVVAHSLGAAATTVAIAEGLVTSRVVYLAPVCWMLGLPEQFCAALKLPARVQHAFWRRLFERFPREAWVNTSGDIASAGMDLPALIFHDKEDKEVPWEGAAAIHQRWRGSQLITTAGLGHRGIVRDPEVVDRAVSFVRGRDQGVGHV